MSLQAFEKQQYLNIETFRKNGQGVKTPVWFAQDGNSLMIWTQIDSGKAKRIRNNSKVRVTPSNGAGEPLGAWIEARAQVNHSDEMVSRVAKLFKQKYGLLFNAFALLGKIRKAKYTSIEVSLL